MSEPEHEITVGVVPDSIDPVEGWRCWDFDGQHLRSLQYGGESAVWLPGQPFEAACHATAGQECRWTFARFGMGRDEAAQAVETINQRARSMSGFASSSPRRPLWCPPLPATEPPDGYGFYLEIVEHTAPSETCTCGVYAARDEAGVPGSGVVRGKVKLWGKVIPGEKGYRAQYAYPSELRVPVELADHPALVAYGVPLVVEQPTLPGALLELAASRRSQPAPSATEIARMAFRDTLVVRRPGLWRGLPPLLRAAVLANVGAACLSLGLMLARVI